MKKIILRYGKFYLTILLSLSVYDFLLFGTNFIYRLPYHLLIVSIAFPVFITFNEKFATKLKYLHYDKNGIAYKKKSVKYAEINKVGFNKFMDVGNIGIKYSKTKYLNLSLLPLDVFQNLKEIILIKANPEKVKYGNKYYNHLWQLSFPLLLFIFTLFLNQKIPKEYFEYNSSNQEIYKTDHYSFQIDEVKYQDLLSPAKTFLVTEKGRILFEENEHYIETALIQK